MLRALADAHNREIDVDECVKKLKDRTEELSNTLMSHEMQMVEKFEVNINLRDASFFHTCRHVSL